MSRRVLILSADIGDGHLTAAQSIATMMRERGAEVHVDGTLLALGRLQRFVLRDGSRILFRFAPLVFSLYYQLLLHVRPVRALAARSLVRFGATPLLRMIDEHQPDVVVSTYPATTVVLGALRESGRLGVPAVATITDLTGLFFWAADGIDVHLVNWSESVAEVMKIAPRSAVSTVAPLTSEEFFDELSMSEARRRLDLPPGGRVVVVSGGGWGVGDLAGAVRAASSLPDTFTVCVAGRDERVRSALEQAFGDRDDVRVLGFTDRMSELLAAADALVHGTGGVTCLEARLRRCPVIVYGFPVGHVRHNADAMSRLGLVTRARRLEELAPLIEAACCGHTGSSPQPAPHAGEFVLAAQMRPTAVVARRRPALRTRTAVGLASVIVLAGSLATTERGEAVARHVPVGRLTRRLDRLVDREAGHASHTARHGRRGLGPAPAAPVEALPPTRMEAGMKRRLRDGG